MVLMMQDSCEFQELVILLGSFSAFQTEKAGVTPFLES